MADFFETFAEFSYFGIFFILIALNAAPLFMPPTWIVLSSFYAVDQTLDPIALALVGATGATIGRLILKQISGYFRRFVGGEQKSNLDFVGGFLNRKGYGYGLAAFLFAATPLPSNMLFVAFGLMKAKNIALYFGFWVGRAIAYYIMISISEVVLTPLFQIFEDRVIGVLVADAIGVGVIIFFISINWKLLVSERKLKFVKPKLWRI